MKQALTVEAIYQDGVFKPLRPIFLPNNTHVEIRVPQTPVDLSSEGDLGVLAGAFPELAALADDDIQWAREQWQRGIDRQHDLLGNDGDLA